jgi:hypothetical protein
LERKRHALHEAIFTSPVESPRPKATEHMQLCADATFYISSARGQKNAASEMNDASLHSQ